MKIMHTYSHLNGLEWLTVHHPNILKELEKAIGSVDAAKCKNKVSKEIKMKGELKYSPISMNKAIKKELNKSKWEDGHYAYYVTHDATVTKKIVHLSSTEQKAYIKSKKLKPIYSKHQTDFVKDRISVEVQFGKYPFIEFDLFVKHLGFYIGEEIDLGIEIIPTKLLQSQMSSGPGYYERVLTHILRQGRVSPPVPLIIFGIEP